MVALDLEPQPIDLGAVLICLRATIDRLDLQFSQLAAEFERSGQWDREGFNSAHDWLRINWSPQRWACCQRADCG